MAELSTRTGHVMDPGLKGKKALVTGGGTGIGRAVALALAQAGVDVAVASRNPDPQVIKGIKALGVKAVRLIADVSREGEVIQMVKQAIDGLGGLDLFINNAAGHWDESVTKVTSEGWFNTLNTNLSACVWACREVSRHFIAQGHGGILIVGSVAAWRPLYRETAYRASKAALKAYMEILAVELAPFGIRVNMLTPGFFPTQVSAHLAGEKLRAVLDNIPLRRAGDPQELGPSALLLLSDRLSPFTTGTELVVDGGQTQVPLPFYSDREIWQMNTDQPFPPREVPVAGKQRVIHAQDVAPFSPPGAEHDFESRLLIDDQSVGSKNLVMNYFTLQPGRTTYASAHPPPYDEVYYVLRGTGLLTLQGRPDFRREMGPDTLAFIPAGTIHQMENTGTEPLDMLTIMPLLPEPGVNTLYDERKKKWGTSFRLINPNATGEVNDEKNH